MARCTVSARVVLACAALVAALSTGAAMADAGSASVARLDGVWAGDVGVTLISVSGQRIVVFGKDPASTWSARCEWSDGRATCEGTAFYGSGKELAYTSVLTPTGADTLEDAWVLSASDEAPAASTTMLHRVGIEAIHHLANPAAATGTPAH